MNTFIQNFTPTGNLRRDVATFLVLHGCADTAGHVAQVAAEAKRLAERFGASLEAAEIAGLLHDISAVIPNEERIAAAHAFGVEVLPEEAAFPMIIHQKLSVVLARDIFGATAPETLSAIGCHTTLKADASLLDKVVFVADKIKWDQAGCITTGAGAFTRSCCFLLPRLPLAAAGDVAGRASLVGGGASAIAGATWLVKRGN